MGLITILIAGLVGTTLMTLFSKIFGLILSKEFSEPKLLNCRFLENRSIRINSWDGWPITLSESSSHGAFGSTFL